MGETKEKVSRSIWVTRIIAVGVMLVAGIVAALQIILFPNVTVRFDTGYGAQQLNAVQVKRGDSIDLPVPLKPGSYFIGWSKTKDGTEDDIITDLNNVTGDTTLYAIWDGVEKYAVLMVDGIEYDRIDIFNTSSKGLSASDLNKRWRLEDDFNNKYDKDDPIIQEFPGGRKVVLKNSYQRFSGWRYFNAAGAIEELLYQNGLWYHKDAAGEVNLINDKHLFYPPNYKTTFHAKLDYRKFNFVFYNFDDSNRAIAPRQEGRQNDKIEAPQYSISSDSFVMTPNFAYWEMEVGNLYEYAPYEISAPRFMPGETLTVDAAWYYLGNREEIAFAGGVNNDDIEITLVFKAKTWTEAENPQQYTMQYVKDTGVTEQAVSVVDKQILETAPETILNVDHPIAYDGDVFWFYKDTTATIANYEFVDHNRVKHTILMNNLKEPYQNCLDLGGTYKFAGRDITFNNTRAIKFIVNYRSATRSINLKFNYGSDLFMLSNDYKFYNNERIVSYSGEHIGNEFTIPNAENYLKRDYLFDGWFNKYDNKMYYSGQIYHIPNLPSDVDTLEFTAIWQEARLLFKFDLNTEEGEHWQAGTPDFSSMKGAYGKTIRIIQDIPAKTGYNFIGWLVNGVVKQPGDALEITDHLNVLQPLWESRDIYVYWVYKTSANGKPYRQLVNTDKPFQIGDTFRLRKADGADNYYWDITAWNAGEFGDEIILDVDTIFEKDLQYKEVGTRMEIEIEAIQNTKRVRIIYDNIEKGDWVEYLEQGKPFISNDPKSPFGLTRELDFDGKEFRGWSYRDASRGWLAIGKDTIVPSGVKEVEVRPGYVNKKMLVEYRGFNGEIYPNGLVTDCSYGQRLPLRNITYFDASASKNADDETFIGWSFDKDDTSGNPEVVFNLIDMKSVSPEIKLSNIDVWDINENFYQVNYDLHNVKLNPDLDDHIYKLILYAVYAKDSIKVTYYQDEAGTQEFKTLEIPVFIGDARERPMLGGVTVGPNDYMFETYGLTVLDESGMLIDDDKSFAGWQIRLPSNSNLSAAVKTKFENRLWFPGDVLESVDFNLKFVPKLVSKGQLKDGIYALPDVNGADLTNEMLRDINFNGAEVIVFPKGDYTINSYALQIDQPLKRIILPANGAIKLEPMAIIANNLTDFYVSDNLELLSGSPVVGNNFKTYHVKKGYCEAEGNPKTISEFKGASSKYNYQASLKGLLISGNQLLSLPSNTDIENHGGLRTNLETFGIQKLASYAIAYNRSLKNAIDLTILNLEISQYAIFDSVAKTIVLPTTDIHWECISGLQPNLQNVYFGTDNNWLTEKSVKSDYAFVSDNVLYYGNLNTKGKDHIIYILKGVKTTSRGSYLKNNLQIESTVTRINKYALASLNWNIIDAISADDANQNDINLCALVGVAGTKIPKFVTIDNNYYDVDATVQTFEKQLSFVYGYEIKTPPKFKYGDVFKIFDPKAENPYNIYFPKEWYQFEAWQISGQERAYKVGETFYIGVNKGIKEDLPVKDSLTFNASIWKQYPVRFHIYQNGGDKEINIHNFKNADGLDFNMNDLIANPNLLNQLYLPGVNAANDYTFTRGGIKYQFVGWGINDPKTYFTFEDKWFWNNRDENLRYLPDGRDDNIVLNMHDTSRTLFNYYALYDAVTDDLTYEYDAKNHIFAVKEYTGNASEIYIPYAVYHEGFMVPVMKIATAAFAGNSNITKICIGGAVSEIGARAFENLGVVDQMDGGGEITSNITFANLGKSIVINNRHNYQMRIGESAFRNNNGIKRIILPLSVTEIGKSAFENCTQLMLFEFKSGSKVADSKLNYIGDFAFKGDIAMNSNAIVEMITNIQTSKNINHIGQGIFWKTKLKNSDNSQNIVWHSNTMGDVLILASATISGGVMQVSENIMGYAFADISTISSIEVLRGSNVGIYANAFSELAATVSLVKLNNLSIGNVDAKAFVNINKNAKTVSVDVENPLTWRREPKFTGNIPNQNLFI